MLLASSSGSLEIFAEVVMAIVFLLYGVAKFADYEARAVAALVESHPLLRIGVHVLGVNGFSRFLGVVELLTALLLFVGTVLPIAGLLGGLLGAATFVVTLSLLPFAPSIQEGLNFPFLSSRGQFLLKDLGLLACCLLIAAMNAASL